MRTDNYANIPGDPDQPPRWHPPTAEGYAVHPSGDPYASQESSSGIPVKGTLVGSFNYAVDLPAPSWEEKRPVVRADGSIDQEDDQICPICLVEYTAENPRIDTQCGHHFHLPCLFEWEERSQQTCPVCLRSPLLFREKSMVDLTAAQEMHHRRTRSKVEAVAVEEEGGGGEVNRGGEAATRTEEAEDSPFLGRVVVSDAGASSGGLPVQAQPPQPPSGGRGSGGGLGPGRGESGGGRGKKKGRK